MPERMQGEEMMMNIARIIKLHGNRFITSIWALGLSIIMVFAVVGYFKNETVAYILLSLFPVAILADISIVISYVVEKNSFAKAGWLLLSLFVFVFTLGVSIADPQRSVNYLSAGILIIYPMMILSFPLSILWIYLYGGVSYIFDALQLSTSIGPNWISFGLTNFVLWIGFAVLGYLQWFQLLPFLINRIRKMGGSRT